MNTRIRYAKLRARKPAKKVPQWIIDRVQEEAKQIAALYGSL